MTALIIDTETTGLVEPEAIEIARIAVDAIDQITTSPVITTRYMPSKPITLGAQAVHHLFIEDLASCEPSGSFALPAGTEYLIGHNVDFDWAAIGKPQVKRICTLALSRLLWPEADSHSLGAMICLIHGIDAKPLLEGAHSASIDARNCAILLGRIVALSDATTFDELWELSEHARQVTDRKRHPAAAVDILERGAKHIRDRAALRDTPEGERSMAKTVTAFNAMFGTHISERQGWQFMELLKVARSSAGGYNADDFEDGAAYAALAGECAAQEAR